MKCPTCRQQLPRTPINAGRPWTPERDDLLILRAAAAKDQGLTADEAIPMLADVFGRTPSGIYSRLYKLDIITE